MTSADATSKLAEINDGRSNPFGPSYRQPGTPGRFDAAVDRLSERLNPILVKEARQALKSRQFVITFSLLLICGWAWSLLGIALASPAIYYAPGGTFMLMGYYFVLAAPVLVVVPFSAFRSLASEREDGTFELLSITVLSSRQIVTGKLGSAMLQMVVYYSALAPCIAFTYLLRGIDIFTIGFVLFHTFATSVLLASLGLVVATVTRSRQWQVVLSVLLLIGLLLVAIIWSVSAVNIIFAGSSMPYQTLDFWTANLAVVCFTVSFVVLFVLVAAAMLSFASDNRSTKLRVVMMVQQLLWIGWMTYCWLRSEAEEVLFVFLIFPAIYWYLVGSLMVGENAQLSPRVKRTLPHSFLGRMMLTWFNPGSGTGYAFAVANMATLTFVMAGLAIVSGMAAMAGGPSNDDWVLFSLLITSYLVTYLGVTRLIVLALRQIAYVGMIVPFLMGIFVALLGCAVPAFLQAWWFGYSELEYTPFQATNWMWTLTEAGEGGIWATPSVPIGMGVVAILVYGLNLLFAMFEVESVRQATPQRVLDDESARKAAAGDDEDGAKVTG